jgi:hypothetical protein
MTVMLELAPEVEQMVKARAEAQGMSLEDYLPSLVAQAVQEEERRETTPALSGPICICSMRRLWDTPEEDAAWKHLEDL